MFIIICILFLYFPIISKEENASDYKKKAEFYLQEKNYKIALSSILIYIKTNPNDYIAHQICAKCYFKMKKLDKAKESAQKAFNLNRSDSLSAYLLGEIYLANKDYDQAIYYFNTSITLNPDYPNSHIGAGKAYLKKNDLCKARREFKIAKEKALIPDMIIYKSIAESYLEANLPNDAIFIYKELLNENPENAELYFLIGKAYEKKGSDLQAQGFFKQAISYDYKKALYHETLGDSYMNSENYSEAMKEYETAVSLGSVSPMTYYRLGLWYYKKNNPVKALPYLEKAVRGKRDLIHAHMALSSIYLKSRKFNKCLEQCDYILRLQPANDTGYYNKACALAMLGKKNEALSNLKRAIELLPENKNIAKEEVFFESIKDTREFEELMK